ncbi:polar amino acid transport system permease protein [Virgibacillus campisalis]|uniref:Polar amino acid transport system permease protein n=2 Tax=Virgibacillus alimentarius TaxID=698769 RepID=A0ABS4S780_9BACI|nr:polar amino acid transport system permease protein [Virgibacillus alimentarius]
MIIISAIGEIFQELMRGVNITVTILIASAFFGFLMAFVAGLCRLSNNAIIRGFTGIYVEFFRGTSLIVQLFWLYYALPILFDIHLGNDFWAGALAIGLNYGAYMSEIVRGSILSVAKGQTEAATALNMSRFQRMRLVILPQAVRMMLPEFGNYLIQMLKATSLVSLIGLTDVLYYGDNFRDNHLSLAPTAYIAVLIFYFILALPLIWFTRKMENASKKGVAS